MRKLNAYLGYVMYVIFMIHAIEMSLFLQKIIPYNAGRKNGGIVMMMLVVIHVVITLFIVWQNRKAGFLKPHYLMENRDTYIQRYTGIALLILIVLHAVGNYWINGGSMIPIFRNWPITQYIVEILMVIVVCVHLNISLKKAAVTLGWVRSEKSKKVITYVTIATTTICGLYAIYGFTCYYVL